MSQNEPLVMVVDEHDQPIGAEQRLTIQKKGLYHRISRVMLEDPDGNILLQLRGTVTDFYPSCWDSSTAGHVDEDEDYLDAAIRETAEEIDLHDIKLEEIGYYQKSTTYKDKILNRFNKIYRGVIPADTKFNLEPGFVVEVKWVTRDELKKLIADHPDEVTEPLTEIVKRFYS